VSGKSEIDEDGFLRTIKSERPIQFTVFKTVQVRHLSKLTTSRVHGVLEWQIRLLFVGPTVFVT
jgi:hypothetical protein